MDRKRIHQGGLQACPGGDPRKKGCMPQGNCRAWVCLGVFGVNLSRGAFLNCPCSSRRPPPMLWKSLPKLLPPAPMLGFCPHCQLRDHGVEMLADWLSKARSRVQREALAPD